MEDEKDFADELIIEPSETTAVSPEAFPSKDEDEEARQKRISLGDFERADWTLAEALHWGVFRDPIRFRRLHRDELRQIALYSGPKCQKKLRTALINGEITAIRDGAAVSKDYWVGGSVWAWDLENMSLRRRDVLKLWPAPTAAVGRDEPGTKALLGKKGRKPKIDWQMVDAAMTGLMELHGEFSLDDPDWNSQACLERAVGDYIDKKFGENAIRAESTIRKHVAAFLEKRKAGI
jgi:hypothetical protein